MSAGRPPGCFLTAQWRHLLMINYAIDPAVLRPLVPPGLALDVYRGEALVSMVGFQFLDTRVLGVPIPFHRRFDEVNLRFYVKRELPGEIRRGVVFVREVVPKRAVALIARRVYNEPYVALPMRSDLRLPSGDRPGLVKYLWRSESRWLQIEASFRGDPAPLREQSEAQFIAEHYWGYGRTRDGRTIEYHVDHPSWNVWAADDARLEGDAARFYGEAFGAALARPPTSAFVADGSQVSVFRGVALEPAEPPA
jgi:hypothetical protein